MNYYTVKQLAKDGSPTGLWHFTITNDDRIWPVGYCAQGCPGHATSDEAREHYRQYQLDTARYDGKLAGGQAHACEVCGAFTQGLAFVDPDGMEVHHLCDEHRNRGNLDSLLPLPGDIWASA